MNALTYPALSRLASAMVVAGCLSAPAAHAVNITWITPGAGNWTDAANWDSNPNLPAAGDTVFITAGGATVSFDSLLGLTYGQIWVDAAGSTATLGQAEDLGVRS